MFSQVSRAFKAPTLEQRFDPRPYPDFMGGTFTISNRGLTPQRATNVEVGLAGGDRVRWSALAYHMETGLEQAFDVRLATQANQGLVTVTGLEAQLGLTLEPVPVPLDTLVIERARRPSRNFRGLHEPRIYVEPRRDLGTSERCPGPAPR